MELEEQAQYKWWVNSQQDPKKFEWSESAKPKVDIIKKVMGFAQDRLNQGRPYQALKGDIWSFAQATGLKQVFKMAELDSDTGKLVRYVYVDESRKRVEIPEGYITVASQHEESKAKARKVFGMES